MECRGDTDEFMEFLWHGRRSFTLMNAKIAAKMAKHTVSNGETVAAALAELRRRKHRDKNQNQKAPSRRCRGGYARLPNRKPSLPSKGREDELEKETGRSGLYMGYPFVTGSLNPGNPADGALLLIPVTLAIENDEALQSALCPTSP